MLEKEKLDLFHQGGLTILSQLRTEFEKQDERIIKLNDRIKELEGCLENEKMLRRQLVKKMKELLCMDEEE